MNIFLFFIFLITVTYLIIITSFSIGWFLTKYYYKTGKQLSTKVSIIIPARNEEDNIRNCLNDIIKQDYPKELFEIIVVDDDSTDNTIKEVNKIIEQNTETNIILSLIRHQTSDIRHQISDIQPATRSSSLSFKKGALAVGINHAKGDLLITTDADCRLGCEWLSTIVDYYEINKPKMLICPVCFTNENTIFKKLQSLEFLSLIAATGGAAKIKLPIMCNGANLAYEKEAFNAVNGYAAHKEFASGDDVFLMNSINKKYPGSVHFIKNENVVAYTEAKRNIGEFISQRKRWVSKTKGYKNFRTIFTALIVYLFNLSLLILLIAGILGLLSDVRGLTSEVRVSINYGNHKLLFIFLCLFISKSLIDFPILSAITSFMKRKHLLKYFIPLQFINIFYVSLMGFIGNFAGYKWKERQIDN